MSAQTGLKLLTGLALRVGSPLSNPEAGSWGPSDGVALDLGASDPYGDAAENPDSTQLGRLAFHGQNVLGGTVVSNSDGTVRYSQPNRLLDPAQLHLIYQRTPDVRAAFDQITRVVATSDWHIDVSGLDPDDSEYEEALEVAEEVKRFLENPTANDWTWQEMVTAWVTDLLKYDSGPVELCRNSKGVLEEIVPVNGGEIIEILDDHGRLLHYKQTPTGANITATPANVIEIPTDRMLMLQLFRSTEGPGGTPLLESLIYEVIAILRGAEHIAQNLDMNEIPPGLLVVTGLANEALERFRARFQADRNRDWKIRMISSQKTLGPVDAKWVEFRKAPRDLQIRELMKDIQRTIWRVIGVMPVTMGSVEGMPRASAQVQLDASSSHLITPILELLAAKINSRIMPLLVPEEFSGLITFSFREEKQLSQEEQNQRADRLAKLVAAGVMTVNEARAELDLDPVEGGDDLKVAEPSTGNDGGGDDDGDGAEDVPDSPGSGADDEDGDTPTQEGRASIRRLKMRARRRVRREGRGRTRRADRLSRGSSRAQEVQRAADLEETLPSDWQPGSRFADHRTISLPDLGEQILGYTRDVAPLWEQARAQTIATIASHYSSDRFDEADRQQLLSRIVNDLDRLLVDWAVTVTPRYDAAALTARDAAGNWISNVKDRSRALEMSSAYRDRAIGYLVAQDGPVGTIRTRISEMLLQISTDRSADLRMVHRAASLKPHASAQEVLIRASEIFDGQRFRINNWSGKLVELAYQVLHDQLDADSLELSTDGARAQREEGAPTNWYVEWVSVHDKGTCAVCEREGFLPMRPVHTLATTPGGATPCRGRCRCVLVYWTSEEVFAGKATKLGKSADVDLDDAPSATLDPVLVEPDDAVKPTVVPIGGDAEDNED